MSKANLLAKKFLSLKREEKATQERSVLPHNSFRAMFDAHDLKEEEIDRLKEIFSAGVGDIEEVDISRSDFRDLLQLTSELKAIQKQAVLLIGERVHRVREIFWRNGSNDGMAFTHWLGLAFNSKKTAYNALAYYELYKELPTEELRQNLKKMPVKVGYVLASRRAEGQLKIEIIQSYKGEKQDEMLHIIDERIPIEGDKRSPKSLGERAVSDLERAVSVIVRRSRALSQTEKVRVRELISTLSQVV